MRKIDTLSSFEGREVLHNIFHHLRYEKRLNSYSCLISLWKICCFEKKPGKFSDEDISIVHTLGFWSGTSLWMEEIVNRFYFSAINSFVYFGAAILLVLIGMRRFSDSITDDIVIAGIIFEAMMLVFMFMVMLFTPKEDTYIDKSEKKENELESDLLNEIGEISRDFAASLVSLETLTDNLQSLNSNQENIANKLESISEAIINASNPNPQMLKQMEITNQLLLEFQKNIQSLNDSIEYIKNSEIQNAVRKEFEKFISTNIK